MRRGTLLLPRAHISIPWGRAAQVIRCAAVSDFRSRAHAFLYSSRFRTVRIGSFDVSLDTSQVLDDGISLHRAGQLAEAEQHYRQILAVEPDHADSLHL